MSNEVFPSLPGLAWSIQRQHEMRADVEESESGRQFGRTRWTYPRRRYRLRYDVLRQGQGFDELQQLVGFFKRHYGSAYTWLFDDPDDNAVTAQAVGVCDGVQTQYQLLRTLGGFTEPVFAPKATPALFLDGYPAGTNLLTNGTFAGTVGLAAVASGWSLYTAGTVGTTSVQIQSTAGQVGGSNQWVQASGLGTGAGDQVGVRTPGPGVNVTSIAGQPYCFSINVWPSTTAPKLCLNIDWYTAGGAYISSHAVHRTLTTNAAFDQYSMTNTAPANAATAYVYAWLDQNAGGPNTQNCNFDAAQLIPGSAPTSYMRSDAKWTLGANGLITFAAAPSATWVLTWTGGYYWRCRFDDSLLDEEQFMQYLYAARQVNFSTDKP